jgi:hypothetical protein
MEWGQQMTKHQENGDAMYHNSNYTNSRETKIPLIIDIEESSAGGQKGLSNDVSFSVNLMEPLIIDQLSDVYLDSCMTMNCKFGNTQDNMSIAVKINQFNNNSRSASTGDNQRINNALLIPNEFNNLDKHNEMQQHKGKKMNYVCSINPTKLSQFTGKITDLNGGQIFSKLLDYVEIIALAEAMPAGTAISIAGASTATTGTTAVDHRKGATDFYYYVDTKGDPNYGSNPTVTITGYTNKAIVADTHIEGIYPRMILEFLIVNRK